MNDGYMVNGHYTAKYYLVKWGPFALLCLIHTIFYIGLNQFYHPARYFCLATPLDYAIPLVPAWSWIYEMLFIFPLAMGFIKSATVMFRGCVAVMTCCVVSWFFFVLFPVSTAGYRPESVEMTGASSILLGFIYYQDGPGTCFPSLHVAVGMTTAFIALRMWGVWWGGFYMFLQVLVALSTLFTKQHYVADVIAGTILAYISYRTIFLGPILDRFALCDPCDLPERTAGQNLPEAVEQG
jgi:membrane-associated phospholipid phosphatase